MVIVPDLGLSVTTTRMRAEGRLQWSDMGVSTVIQHRAPLTGTNIGPTMIDGYDNHSEYRVEYNWPHLDII